MSNRTLSLDDRLYDYLISNSLRETPLMRRLREETAKLPMAQMQIAPEQGQFMGLMAELIGAKRAIEVGTFTGYSSLAVAQAMGPGSQLIACDVSEEYTAIARRYWAEAGIADRIRLKLAPAVETLDALIAEGWTNSVDLAFIDADKKNYGAYFDRLMTLMRRGGLIMIDNVLWGGEVADPAAQDEDTRAIRALNERLKTDARISLSLLPVGDGLTLARKR